MTPELRKSGIGVVGDIPWGAHFCSFYDTREDLLDILVPFFKTGLENKEFCLWVISNSELLTTQEAASALRNALPDLDRYVAEGSLEVVGHDEWFLVDGVFSLHRVANRFIEKLDEALARGYAGMRLNGSPAWLQSNNAKELCEFEEEVEDLFNNQRILASCTYPLATITGVQVFETVRTHQFAIARRQRKWEAIETPQLIQAKAEIKRLNEELEQRVVERTNELRVANEELTKEIAERKRIEEQVRSAEGQSRKMLDTIPQQIWSGPSDGTLDYCNYQWRAYAGLELEELQGDGWQKMLHPDDKERVLKAWYESVATGKPYEQEERHRRADGVYRWFLCRGIPMMDAEGRIERWFGSNTDITELKEAEDALRRSEDHLRLVLDTTPALIHTGRPDGYHDYFNQRWLEYVGRSLEEVQDWGWTASIHPDDVEGIVNQWRTSLASGEPLQHEARVRQADGEYRWMLHCKVPLRDEHGNIVKWYGSSIDIEDRKQAEMALDERLRFETLLTELSATFANLSANEVDREIENWLQTLAEFLRVDRASFFQFGEDWSTLYRSHSYTVPGIEPLPPPPIGMKDQFPFITDQFRRGVTVKWSRIPDEMPEEAAKEKEYAARLGAKSGLNIPVLVGGSVICAITFTSIATYHDWPDALVARLRLVGEIFAGAVERKRAEAALKKEKETFEKIFDNIPVMIGFVDEDGVRLVNPEWERTIGWTLKELQEQNADIFVEAYPDAAYRQRVLGLVDAATGEWFDLKIRVRDGRIIDAACAVVHLSDGTRVAIAQDITERKRAEEHIQETSEQLRALSARLQSAKEEEDIRIAREIHDEMGSSLTSLRWELERFDEVVSETNESSQLQALRVKIADMVKLTDVTIGAMRRIASELRPSVLDDLGLAEAIEWQSQQFQTRTGIVCRCDCSLENLDFDQEQATAIFRIFQEALTNVLSHSGATAVEVVARAENSSFVLTVSDNGRGITEQEKTGRLSLGILGMRERAHLIGGEFSINGIEGRGTVVTVSVPISQKANR